MLRCFSIVNKELNVTPNISSYYFSTVTPIVDRRDRGCTERDLQTIIVGVLLALNFHTQMSTLPRSSFRDFARLLQTAGLWHNSYQSAVIGITDQLSLQNGREAPRCSGGIISTYYYPQSRAYREYPDSWPYQSLSCCLNLSLHWRLCLKLHNPSRSCPLYNALNSSLLDTHKWASQVPRHFR